MATGSVRPGLLLAVAGGLLLIYSGIRGKKVTSALRDVINGQSPTNAASNVITGTSAASLANSSLVTGTDTTRTQSDIANAALRGQGHCYNYGGVPGPSGRGCWDCSSFCNYVVGVECGRAIPGYGAGKYTGAVHGPPTGAWLIWPGVATIARSKVQAGDLCVWQTHMGIAISDSEMVSAQDAQLGTNVGSITNGGPGGEILVCKRLR